MISLEKFKKIMIDIQKQEKKDDTLTKLLVDENCYGWISTADILTDDLIDLLQENLNDEYEHISWWLYDFLHDDEEKHVYEPIDDEYDNRFDLTELDDLYYYIIGDLNKVKQEKVKKETTQQFPSYCIMDDLKDNLKERMGME